jgi:hypothetical protein
MIQLPTNPYESTKLNWRYYNDFVDYLNTLQNLEIFNDRLVQAYYKQYMSFESASEQRLYYEELVTEIEPTALDPVTGEVDLPISFTNVAYDLLTLSNPEDVPKVAYFLYNPTAKTLPTTFNAITNPECFEILSAGSSESLDNSANYQSILAKTLDTRNNKLDARAYTGSSNTMSLEQVVGLAQGGSLEDTYNKRNNYAFSPNSLVNTKTVNDQVSEVDQIKVQNEALRKVRDDQQKHKMNFLKQTDNKPVQTLQNPTKDVGRPMLKLEDLLNNK